VRPRCGALLLVLWAAVPVRAEPPKVPTGPVVAPVGGRPQVVTVEVPKEFGMAPAFSPEDCLLFPGEADASGRKVYLVQPYRPGVYRAVFWTKGETAYSTLVIDASGAAPTPPGPKPPDPVVPPVPPPDGKLGLVKASRDGLAKVTTPGKAAAAGALARAQRSLASAIAAGGVTEPAKILEAWRDANKAAVGAPADWKPWGDAVTPALQKAYTDGRLADKAAWAAAFEEIALGLEG
jgi:hypothetical protein